MSRSIAYTSSPLLASPTPVWRSKFIVAVIALSFAGLVARAVYIQIIENEFFQRQGEVRFARTLALPVEYYDEERYYKDVGSRWIGWGSSGESGTGIIPPSTSPAGVAGSAPTGSGGK